MSGKSILFAFLIFVNISHAQTFRKIYKGLVGPDTVSLTLISKSGTLTGTYYYKNSSEPISVRGFITGRSIEITGIDTRGNKIEKFIGQIGKVDIHGICIGEESGNRNAFNLKETGVITAEKKDSPWKEFITPALILLTAILVFIFVKNQKWTVPAPKMFDGINTTLIEKIIPSKKEYLFEKFITDKFGPEMYRLHAWHTPKNHIHKDGQPYEPSLVFEKKQATGEHRIFSIECKYKSSSLNNSVDLGQEFVDEQIKKGMKKNNQPRFVALGLGGTASAPDSLYIVPAELINKNKISLDEFSEFKITGTSLTYDPANKSLH